jgi:methyl-accepting chemotaxis protein
VSFSNTAYRWHSDPSPDATLPLDIPEEASEAERYRAERDHRRHTFDQLAARFLGPVIVVNDEGRLTHWNCEQAQFTDTDAEVAPGRPAHEVIGTEHKTETPAETVTETGDAVRESDVRTVPQGDDDRAYVKAVDVPLTAPCGETVGAFEFVYRVAELVSSASQSRMFSDGSARIWKGASRGWSGRPRRSRITSRRSRRSPTPRPSTSGRSPTRSEAETGRIEKLIESVSGIAADAIQGVKQTTDRVSEIESRVGTVQDNQREIRSATVDVSNQLEQIAAATDEQAAGAEDVSAKLTSTAEEVERIADEVTKLAAANRRRTEQVTEIGRNVDALERSLESVTTGE